MINYQNVQPLYDKYFDLVRFEVENFGVKPTEIRHLIGRLGEFYCVKESRGALPSRTNQPGFDVTSYENRKISVKTTAQTSGFVAISKNTVTMADDLMLIHYVNGKLSTIYHGCIKVATMGARQYGGYYELDISKARKLAISNSRPTPGSTDKN
jgi:hypothetical protein